MYRRKDNTGKLIVAACASLGFLIVIGYLLLWLHPPTDLDRACLGKALVEIGDCINEFKRRQ